MIASFTFENFFSIKSPETLSFTATTDKTLAEKYTCEVAEGVRLLKVGILYGANASGKSNILLAFDFFRQIVLKKPKDKNRGTGRTPFLLDDTSKNAPTKMSMTFYIGRLQYILSFEMDNRVIHSETLTVYETSRPTMLYSRRYDPGTDSSVIDFSTKLGLTRKSRDVISGNAINNCSVLATIGSSNIERTKLNDVYEYFLTQVKSVLQPRMYMSDYVKKSLAKDERGKLKEFILKLLKASDFNIEDISLQKKEEAIPDGVSQIILNSDISEEQKEIFLKRGTIPTSTLNFVHRGGGGNTDFKEDLESVGTMRYMGLAVMLYSLLKGDLFFAIDEIETSISYDLLVFFLKAFLLNSRRTSQLLFTTHDINLLDEDFIRRDTIWFADKDECGETKLVRLSSLGLHKNVSPYNAYRQGKLVKIPFLDSPYFDIDE